MRASHKSIKLDLRNIILTLERFENLNIRNFKSSSKADDNLIECVINSINKNRSKHNKIRNSAKIRKRISTAAKRILEERNILNADLDEPANEVLLETEVAINTSSYVPANEVLLDAVDSINAGLDVNASSYVPANEVLLDTIDSINAGLDVPANEVLLETEVAINASSYVPANEVLLDAVDSINAGLDVPANEVLLETVDTRNAFLDVPANDTPWEAVDIENPGLNVLLEALDTINAGSDLPTNEVLLQTIDARNAVLDIQENFLEPQSNTSSEMVQSLKNCILLIDNRLTGHNTTGEENLKSFPMQQAFLSASLPNGDGSLDILSNSKNTECNDEYDATEFENLNIRSTFIAELIKILNKGTDKMSKLNISPPNEFKSTVCKIIDSINENFTRIECSVNRIKTYLNEILDESILEENTNIEETPDITLCSENYIFEKTDNSQYVSDFIEHRKIPDQSEKCNKYVKSKKSENSKLDRRFKANIKDCSFHINLNNNKAVHMDKTAKKTVLENLVREEYLKHNNDCILCFYSINQGNKNTLLYAYCKFHDCTTFRFSINLKGKVTVYRTKELHHAKNGAKVDQRRGAKRHVMKSKLRRPKAYLEAGDNIAEKEKFQNIRKLDTSRKCILKNIELIKLKK